MGMGRELVSYGSGRLTRKAAKSVPWFGAAIALLTIVGTMRRKGVVRGGVDTALTALPWVGAAKNVAEVMRGRDFIPDRPARVRTLPR
jgi:hypothetical protein